MKARVTPVEKGAFERWGSPAFCGWARGLLLRLLGKVKQGRIHLRDGDLRQTFGCPGTETSLEARVTVLDPAFYPRALLGGSVGAGEAFMLGLWRTENLPVLIRIILRNAEVFQRLDSGWSRLAVLLDRGFQTLHRDTKRGSRANIAAHYDLGNDFYRLFLDETLTYSCGLFEDKGGALKEASLAKYDRICQKLGLTPSDHVLEIGAGWGGFALFAAGRYGCRVTAATISEEQYRLAQARIAEAGLQDRIRLVFRDYRDLEGRYDKLVSIEMIEAVGHQYLEAFFRACSDRLKEDGMMMLQAITIRDQAYERHKRSADFIKRYIFPGSCIPSLAALSQAVARGTDLRIDHLEDITRHYPPTLRAWRRRFFDNIEQVRALGFSEAFVRMWEYYLSYCEAGFEERYLGDVQMRLVKPLCRAKPILPPLERRGNP